MERILKKCLQISLKLANLTLGTVGIAMLMYGLWMIRVWQRDAAGSGYAFPWFVHAFLGIGIGLCAITFLGHFAAHTANPFCLTSYMLTIFLLLLAETGLLADVYLNSDWEKDLPEDPSGRFNDFKNFVKNNSEDFQWITLFIVLAQGVSILLATVLRTLGRDRRYERENGEPRVPLLNQPDQTLPAYPYVLGEPRFPCKNV
nr:tetraspanin-19-like [Ipomoea trifida]GMC83866.1 tetraspanin-19-like [Ipomoea batatas]GME17571.1 tetraspanin-19-like [Ipomoea batatas]